MSYNGAPLLTGSFTISGGGTPTPTPTPPTTSVGAAVIIDGTDANQHGSANSTRNSEGWLYMQKALENLASRVNPNAAKVVVNLGATGSASSSRDARDAITAAFELSPVLRSSGWTLRHVDGAAAINDFFNQLSTANTGILYLPTYNLCAGLSGDQGCSGDLEPEELAAINAQAGRLATFINGNGGALFAMGESNSGARTGAWGWLSALLPGIVPTDVTTGGINTRAHSHVERRTRSIRGP